MNAINLSQLRKELKKYLDHVYEDHEPLIVTRKNNQNVIMISMEDYNSLIETHYLLSIPQNANRILNSLKNARKGKLTKKDLVKA